MYAGTDLENVSISGIIHHDSWHKCAVIIEFYH